MSTMYNAIVNVGRVEPLDEYIDAFADYGGVLYGTPTGTLDVIITVPATSLRQAAVTALALVQAAGLTPQALEVLTTEAFDARDYDDDGVTISVAEAAELLGVTPSAVRQRLNNGTLPGQRVGRDWRLPRTAVVQVAEGRNPDPAATRYTTRAEAVAREIVEPIEAGDASADDYDVDAIADEVLGDHDAGYAVRVDVDEFWQVVERHPR